MAPNIERVRAVPTLPRRAGGGYKNQYGHVLCVGGSREMMGALALMANGALRGGAGLVTMAAPATIQPFAATLAPCAMSIALECDAKGELSPGSVRQMLGATRDVTAMGPGMGKGAGQRNLVLAAIGQEMPLVLDADGLNNLAMVENWAASLRCPLILTPHVGEFARLVGGSSAEIQAHREDVAVAAVRQWREKSGAKPIVLVLKGAGTVVTDGARLYVNDTGNAGMATGGSGDVLTGLAAALVGQGLSLFDAAVLAVWAHGRAGDLAAEELGEASLIASDLVDYLPYAIQEAAAPK